MPEEIYQKSAKTKESPKGLRETIRSAIDWLKVRQENDGMWCGPLETNCCMEAQWILAMYFIGFDDPKKPKVLQYILDSAKTAHGTYITIQSTAI